MATSKLHLVKLFLIVLICQFIGHEYKSVYFYTARLFCKFYDENKFIASFCANFFTARLFRKFYDENKFIASFCVNFVNFFFPISETGLIEKKSMISHENDETISNTVPNNGESTTGVATKTTYESTGKNGFCYPAVCVRSEAGKDVAFCWCCSSNRFCSKDKQECSDACN